MEDLFLAIGDLPFHPLVVHFAVALFPLALIFLIVAVLRDSWRKRYLMKSTFAVALTVPFIFLAQQSGQALSKVMYKPEPHSEYGETLMPLAIATLVVALFLWWSMKKLPKLVSQVAGFLVISLAIASIAMTVVVGHSGAAATWSGVVP